MIGVIVVFFGNNHPIKQPKTARFMLKIETIPQQRMD